MTRKQDSAKNQGKVVDKRLTAERVPNVNHIIIGAKIEARSTRIRDVQESIADRHGPVSRPDVPTDSASEIEYQIGTSLGTDEPADV